MSDDPYQSRDGERRLDDSSLIVRLATDVAHWWGQRSGLLAKTVTMLTFVGTIGGGIASGLIAVGSMRANYAGIPDRVESLEGRQGAISDTVSYNRQQVQRLQSRVSDLRSDVSSLRSSIAELKSLAEANNCWIRVAADAESRFNCTAAPDDPDG